MATLREMTARDLLPVWGGEHHGKDLPGNESGVLLIHRAGMRTVWRYAAVESSRQTFCGMPFDVTGKHWNYVGEEPYAGKVP